MSLYCSTFTGLWCLAEHPKHSCNKRLQTFYFFSKNGLFHFSKTFKDQREIKVNENTRYKNQSAADKLMEYFVFK